MTGSFNHSCALGGKETVKVISSSKKKFFGAFSTSYLHISSMIKKITLRLLLIKNRIQTTKQYQYCVFLMRRKLVMFTMIMVPIGSGAGIIYNDDGEEIVRYPHIESAYVLRSDDVITIAYDNPVKDIEYREDIVLSPEHEVVATWNDTRDQLTITPSTPWYVQKRYSLTLPEGSYKNGDTLPASTFLFDTTAYPRVKGTSVQDGQKNVPFSLDRGITITLEESPEDVYVNFVLSPAIPVDITSNADRSIFTLTPKKLPEADATYTLTTSMRPMDASSKNLLPMNSISFTTLSEQPDAWPEDFAKRLTVAKKYTRPQTLSGKYIDVNLRAQITTLFEDGKFVANFVSSAGLADTPTPTGEFQIHNKDEYALSQMFQMYLPYWMAFTEDGKYGFHDLPVWPEGHPDLPTGGKESLKSIGVPNSPGCVRHDASSSKTIYDWTPVGTKVIIY